MKSGLRTKYIRDLHSRSLQGVLFITGGGSLLISDLLQVPGSSSTVLEAIVPYSTKSISELLQVVPDQHCSDATARMMAMHAYLRAIQLSNTTKNSFGFAITASLRSKQRKRGGHRAHIALQTNNSPYSWHLDLENNVLTRKAEERLVADTGLLLLTKLINQNLRPAYIKKAQTAKPKKALIDLMNHDIELIGTPKKAFLPGAFNPLHEGHRRMREIAQQKLKREVQYELCITNVDKAPLDYVEIRKRQKQFVDPDLILTNTPTFLEKATALSQGGTITFVVGIDTIVRIAAPSYYGNSQRRDSALEQLVSLGCRFLVFGRIDTQKFVTLKQVRIPKMLRQICQGIKENEFRMDISSSVLRQPVR